MKRIPRLAAILALTFLLPSPLLAAESDDEPLPTHLPLIVRIDDESQLDWLEEIGAQVLRRRADMLLTLIPVDSEGGVPVAINPGGGARLPQDRLPADRPQRAKGSPGLTPLPLRTPLEPTLDKAVANANALDLKRAAPEGRGLTGKGVVLGMSDIGFDPSHPAFLDPATGASRIRRLTAYDETFARRTELTEYEEMLRWQTDNPDNTHATHVAGIMTGAGVSTWEGMAPGADLCVSTSSLYDVGLLAGVEDIVEQARLDGHPAVVNLSMASFTGPHDGTSYFSQYLDMVAEEAVVVISAGNYGMANAGFDHTFAAPAPGQSTKPLPFRLCSSDWENFEVAGMTQAWDDADQPLEFELAVWDCIQSKTILTLPRHRLGAGTGRETLSFGDDDFQGLLTGRLDATGGVWDENNRYCLSFSYDLKTEENQQSTNPDAGHWARYNLAVRLYGSDGQRIRLYSDVSRSFPRAMEGGPQPSADLSFSDLATGHNVISVGMANNRASAPLSGGGMLEFGAKDGICPHSSYSTLLDGRVMPLTVAPGMPLVSAASRPWAMKDPERTREYCGAVGLAGKRWGYIAIGGTSMSAPLVAGCVALWLEAAPGLTPDKVREIVLASNAAPTLDADDPRWGRGCFDAEAGLLLALQEGGSRMETAGNGEPVLALCREEIHALVPTPCELQLFSLDGSLLATLPLNAGHNAIPLSDLPRNVLCLARAAGKTLKLLP